VSRSYRKGISGCREIWTDKNFRIRNSLCIHREMRNPDYGDIVFPIRREYFDIIRCKDFDLRKETRDKYFLEIRNILNGYADRYNDYADETFIEDFNRIKGFIPNNDIWEYCFEWLNNKKIKKAIKSWSGEPLKILKHLTDKGLIEQVVRLKIKLSKRK